MIDAAWTAGGTVIYVDETTLITPARTLLPALGKAIRTGRERMVGVWCASQRPKELPSAIFTESEHIFTFCLSYSKDRDKVREFTSDGYGDAIDGLDGHRFAHYDVASGVSQRFKPIRVAAPVSLPATGPLLPAGISKGVSLWPSWIR